jgi:hypothetical protein
MATTYSWKITSVKKGNVDALSDVVLNVRWEKKGVDEDGNEGKFQGATPFTAPHESAFIPFNDLTEEIVLNWVKAVVVGSYEEHVNGQIQKQIDEQKNPVTEVAETELPWATN